MWEGQWLAKLLPELTCPVTARLRLGALSRGVLVKRARPSRQHRASQHLFLDLKERPAGRLVGEPWGQGGCPRAALKSSTSLSFSDVKEVARPQVINLWDGEAQVVF